MQDSTFNRKRIKMIDQTIINWLLGGFGALIGALLNAVWQAVKDLQTSDKELTSKLSEVEILVAGTYVKRSDLERLSQALFTKLDRIEAKVDTKADK